jgi:ketosteroid isomerase-like protein
VWFHGDEYTVMVVDDGEGNGPADGVLRYITIPNGTASTESRSVDVTKFAHVYTYKRTAHIAADEIAAADRQFSVDTGKDKIDGWMKWFDATGGQLRKGKRVEGDAIREMMGPLLASGTLAWAPLTSGRPAPTSTLGFSVGTAKFTADKPETPDDNWASAYITIWKQQADGGWKVTFDTGRPTNAPSP